MADLTEGPGPDADAPPAGSSEPRDWGRILDVAGIIAGIALVVIVIDVWSDGRFISRRLHRKDEDDDRAAD